MRWIIDQKRYQFGYFIGSIFVLAAELTLLSISMLLFCVAAGSRKTDWYDQAIKLEVSTDIFAGNRSDSIFIALSAAIAFVCVFAVISICIFRRLQLESMEKHIGVFLICGYTRREMEQILNVDTGIDILISMPFSVYLTVWMLNVLKRKEEFLVMLNSMQMDDVSYGILFLGCMFILYIVIACYGKVWLKKTAKGGLTSMLR